VFNSPDILCISRITTALFQEKASSVAIFIFISVRPIGFYRGYDTTGLRSVKNTVTFLYQLKSAGEITTGQETKLGHSKKGINYSKCAHHRSVAKPNREPGGLRTL